jgi:hypothetical protein
MLKTARLWIYCLLAILLAVVAVTVWRHRPGLPQTHPGSTSNVTTLPSIPAPTGWQPEQEGAGSITFAKEGSSVGERINVSAIKTSKPLDEWLATLYNGGDFPYATLTASSSPSGAQALSWALVNGSLILVDAEPEGGGGVSLNYSVYNNGNVYIFTLSPYELYDPTEKAMTLYNPANIQTLKQLVQDFVVILPSAGQ